MLAAVTSLPRVRFFIFHYESGLVLKIISKSIRLVRLFPHFFIFHIRALLTEEMEKEHAHINGGGCDKLATCLLFHFSLREWPRFESFRKVFVWCAFFSVYFFFHIRALLTKEMKKEHAHINGGGCDKLATCLLFHFSLREWPRFENRF